MKIQPLKHLAVKSIPPSPSLTFSHTHSQTLTHQHTLMEADQNLLIDVHLLLFTLRHLFQQLVCFVWSTSDPLIHTVVSVNDADYSFSHHIMKLIHFL